MVEVQLPDGRTTNSVIKVWDPTSHGYDEIDFYENWAPRLPIRLPECFAAHATMTAGVVVLERLEGVRQGDAATVARDDAAAVARVLARIHRSTVGSATDLAPTRWTRTRPDSWHDTRRVAFVEAFGLPESGPLRAVVVNSRAADAIAIEVLSAAHPGLVHGDVHLDNVVFLDDEPVLLDWPRVGWGAAAVDLAGLLLGYDEPDGYSTIVDQYRGNTEVTDEALLGGILLHLVIGTLGVAKWQPTTDRQARLKRAGIDRVADAAAWLFETQPDLLAQLNA